jgi:hypothetical protein
MRLAVLAALALVARVAAAQSPRATARDAYLWGYPVVDMHAILTSQALDPASPQFTAPLNAIGHARGVATPEDRAVIAPNVDTPYSHAWLDLRAEPVVITVPPFGRDRYVSVQLFDLYTWIIGYVTPRTNGNAGGTFLVAPPGWDAPAPPGITATFRSTTDLALALVRIQLLGELDLPEVHALQDRFRVEPLSVWLGAAGSPPRPLPPPVPTVNLRQEPTTPAFFTALDWMLQFMPPLPDETAMRARFAQIGIVPGQPFTPAGGATTDEVVAGMQDGAALMSERARRTRSSSELFGSRAQLGRDYTTRATGALLGILGNGAEEYLGVGYSADADGRPFDGARRYRIRFAPGGLPPVGAFWSLTVYTSERLLYANPLRRYVINSPMLGSLQRDADGGITLYLQHDSPGADHEANWLPVPSGPFVLTFRTYQPDEAIRSGRWTAPPVVALP